MEMNPSKCLIWIGSALLTIGFTLGGAAPAAADEPQHLTPPFVAAQDGYPKFRIPAVVVTKAGTVVAFAEGRASIADHAANDMVLKRSTDGGRTWGPLIVVAEDGDNCLNNPTALVLRDSGRILLMYQRYPKGIHEHQVKPGVSGDQTCLNFLVSSDDDGKTWSKPREITPQTKPAGATSIASGPGIGIELRRGRHAGRIVFPFNHGPLRDCQVYAAYSDDRGKTWKYGDVAPAEKGFHGNEVQMVELSDGSVMLNSRGHSGKGFRKVAVSGDGGQTWSKLRDDAALPESRCQGSIIRYEGATAGGKGAILFVNPAVPKGRTKGTVRLSEDDGATWSVSRELVPGDFAYSCLAVLPDGSILCLYETDNYGRIALTRFTMDWLRGGQAPARP